MVFTRRQFVSGAALLCAAPSLATLGCEIEQGVCTAYTDCPKPGEEEAAFQESLDSFWDGFGPKEFTSLEGQARWLWLPSEQHADGSFAQSSRATAEGSSIAPWARFGDRDGYVESLRVDDDESGRHVTLNNRWSDPVGAGPGAVRRTPRPALPVGRRGRGFVSARPYDRRRRLAPRRRLLGLASGAGSGPLGRFRRRPRLAIPAGDA